jgi:hypothetical protein
MVLRVGAAANILLKASDIVDLSLNCSLFSARLNIGNTSS